MLGFSLSPSLYLSLLEGGDGGVQLFHKTQAFHLKDNSIESLTE